VKTTDENITAYTLKPTWDKQPNADYYEIEFDGMIYSTIQNNHLTFTGLVPETTYSYKIRSVNMDGVSQWDSYTATTKSNPLEFAIQNITAETSVKNQGGQGIITSCLTLMRVMHGIHPGVKRLFLLILLLI